MNEKINIIDLHFQHSSDTIASFLIETSIGPVLVETGPHTTLPYLEKEINRLGYELADIKHVFITHIHLDHAGAAWAFAAKGATIYVHPAGVYHLSNPQKLIESAKRIYKDDMDRLWGTLRPIPDAQVQAIAHQQVITIGDSAFKAWHTPGHAIHHIAWQLNSVLFTGDVAGVKIEDGPVVPPCPPPDINLEDWENSIDLIKQINPTALFLTHFGKVAQHQIIAHLDELKTTLRNWANWILPHFEADKAPKEVEPHFMKYVQDSMNERGCPEKLIELYEYANPSWMSVAGLLRYWHKRK